MTENSYQLLEQEERKEQYIALMKELLTAYYEGAHARIQKAPNQQKKEWKKGLIKVLERAAKDLRELIYNGQKGRIQYVHFSYLLSGALSEELLIRLDAYDKRYYRDVEEVECYWDYSSIFPDFSAEFNRLAEELRKRMIRVQSSEVSRLKIGMMVLNAVIMETVLSEMIISKEVEQLLEEFCEEKACILYGTYLDQAEVIHQLGGGQDEILSS
ncbi:MAG: hypothetical protein IJP31_01160 [Lachnospiraceae bacterium]|nr:hypothetical protein [Lachnospiraceae bacterium]